MIALIVGAPSGSAFHFTELAADLAPRAPRLSLVAAAPADGRQTVAQFCAARGMTRTNTEMSRIGRRAAALSRAAGHLIGRVFEAYGEVNTYEPAVLTQAFEAAEAA
ncbi:hypothetical protein ASF61_06650 [Duganella sp. Leaf126]|uniref:hypothetical protein n=1 Tax=Duganella sp. Leaf126 TaxID=1736266 RepID=UPI0006F2024E|nr:hypothetical protein [Duganella sp. Leaf126]KQQ40427.1 hypothetical protein ASF61_06650 [Duganella sp. Leaf126]